ncbi:lantibiotic dehydratase [Streptococcus agalactiae]|uniref:lantibiotic dehydratase n=1 Tax=Streptococcus agalactiae TaxID=1311 RepID=UPI000640641A|nr:lantibiotic dehydratase [Streptococcus agalactiae]KLL30096.1 lantibiotic dehydratase [Streptococcus agalactiae]KLL94627.1 lantibiotic dehydratase [Streptococcus agalactiae]
MEHKYTTNNFLVRNAIIGIHELLECDYNSFLETIRENKIFQEQLFVASRSLYESLQKYYSGDSMKRKKINQLSESVYKYYKRSKERSTPFGLFSETSIGSFSSTEKLNLNGKTLKKVLLDSEWLIRLVFKIEKEYSRELAYKINPANYQFGDRVVQLFSINDTKIEEVNIKFTKVYQLIDELCCDKYVYFNCIIEKLVESYGEEYRDIATSYIMSLIDSHFLISNINSELIMNFKFEEFISKVKEIDKQNLYYFKLIAISNLIVEYSELEIGDGIEKLKEIYKLMSSLVETPNFLQIDLYNDGQIQLGNENKTQIVEFAEFLVSNSDHVKRTYLDDYKEKFLDKYGVNREVQLMELFDSNLGIGSPYGYQHPKNDFWESSPSTVYFSEKEELEYLNNFEKALETGGNIQLYNEEDFFNQDKDKINLGFELFFYVNKVDGKSVLSLTNTGCSKNLGASSGRFSILSDKLEHYHQTITQIVENNNHVSGYNSCEITFLPENLRHANVMRTTNVREKVLSLFTNMDKRSQILSDIYIGIDSKNSFYARNFKTKELLKFYSTNMYNQMMFSNELRFLCEIAQEDHFGIFPWEMVYQKFSHIPRIVFKDIIVAPERWRLSGRMLSKDIHQIILENNLPTKLYVDNSDNRILINRNNPLDNQILKLVNLDDGMSFYIRYTDPKFHIRLRIRTQNLYKSFEKIQEIFQLCIQNKLISNIDISTYDREIERYGGLERIPLVEEIFCLDTEIVINSLSLIRQKRLDLTLDDLAIIFNYFYLKSFFKDNNKEIIQFLEFACPEHLDSQNRDKNRNTALIDLYLIKGYLINLLPELSKLCQRLKKLSDSCIQLSDDYTYIIYDSIIHVHNNRLFGIKRENETKIYAIIRGLIISEEFRNGHNHG